MKQEYISPEMEIIEFETEDVIQDSVVDAVRNTGGFTEEYEEGE